MADEDRTNSQTEPQRRVDPELESNLSEGAAQPTKAEKGIAVTIKAWADAATSVAKASVLGLIVFVLALTIWHGLTQTVVTVDIDSEAEKLLPKLGAYLDLRAILLDETNSRIDGVRSFLKRSFPEKFSLEGPQRPLSLKPLGFDWSTNDLTNGVRTLLGGRPAWQVRMDIFCNPAPCGTGSSGNSRPALAGEGKLVLIVDIKGAQERSERLSFTMSQNPLAIQRGLHQAMRQTSEKLLERVSPLLGGVYYLNAPRTSWFFDDQQRYLSLAASAIFPLRSEGPERRCLADVVFADSMVRRGDFEDGVQRLLGIIENPDRSGGNVTCRVQAGTDIIFHTLLNFCPLPNSSADRRKERFQLAAKAMDLLNGIGPAEITDVEQDRVKAFRVYLKTLQTLFLEDMQALKVVCRQVAPPISDRSIAIERYQKTKELIQEFRSAFPLTRGQTQVSEAAAALGGFLLEYVSVTVPSTFPAERIQALNGLIHFVEEYSQSEGDPGALFLIKGNAYRELALLVASGPRTDGHEGSANEQEPQSKLTRSLTKYSEQALYRGQLAYENAAAAKSRFPWLRDSIDLEGLIGLGDLRYLTAGAEAAESAYARATSLFLDRDAPTNELLPFAKAVTRWAVIRRAEGACGKPARQSQWEEAVWTKVGASTRQICALGELPETTRPNETDSGLLAIVLPLALDSLKECKLNGQDKLALIECLTRTGPESPADVVKFLRTRTGAGVDEAVGRALDRH